MLTLDEREELVSEEAFPDFPLKVLLAACRNSGLPKSNALLEVLDDGALALAGRALDGGERIVVEKPAGVDDAADAESGSTDHPRDEVDVHHDPYAAGAASGEVEFPAEEELLEVGQLPDDLSDNVPAHEGLKSMLENSFFLCHCKRGQISWSVCS